MTKELRPFVGSDHISIVKINGPQFLEELSQFGSLGETDKMQPQVFVTGSSSACFLLGGEDGSRVLKMRAGGLKAERKALKKWRKKGTNTPKIYDHGIVPTTMYDEVPVSWMTSETIVGPDGKPAPIGLAILTEQPELATDLGQCMGAELATMHKTTSKKPYGSYADGITYARGKDTIGEFLVSVFDTYQYVLPDLCFEQQDVRRVARTLGRVSDTGERFVTHNDFLTHNVLIPSITPLEIVVMDPHPIIGNHYSEFAQQANRVAYLEKKAALYPEKTKYKQQYEREKTCYDALQQTYISKTGRVIDPEVLVQYQLPFAMKLYSEIIGGAIDQLGVEEVAARVSTYQEIIGEQMERVIKSFTEREATTLFVRSRV